jgi:hypothetical protein
MNLSIPVVGFGTKTGKSRADRALQGIRALNPAALQSEDRFVPTVRSRKRSLNGKTLAAIQAYQNLLDKQNPTKNHAANVAGQLANRLPSGDRVNFDRNEMSVEELVNVAGQMARKLAG